MDGYTLRIVINVDQHTIWAKLFLEGWGYTIDKHFYQDNTSAIKLEKMVGVHVGRNLGILISDF